MILIIETFVKDTTVHILFLIRKTIDSKMERMFSSSPETLNKTIFDLNLARLKLYYISTAFFSFSSYIFNLTHKNKAITLDLRNIRKTRDRVCILQEIYT